MKKTILEIQSTLPQEHLAAEIARQYDMYRSMRTDWERDVSELRRYLFATDTTKTTNSQLPWKNKTTLPKLTQLRDNLHANYIVALFSGSRWFTWQPADIQGATKEKRRAIEAYMQQKLEQSGFYSTVSQLLLDYIDYGNAIASVDYVVESHKNSLGETVVDYVGPKLIRHSPMSVVFNPKASEFKYTPKIIRHVKTIAELMKDAKENPTLGIDQNKIKEMLEHRSRAMQYSAHDLEEAFGFRIEGFGDLKEYFGSQQVEILEFWGDLYDMERGELLENQVITVADRRVILRQQNFDTWSGAAPFFHARWRDRPGNLYGMGPLDNLVGMQYRIDHLENMKADIFDLVVHPVLKIRGTGVEDFNWQPGARIIVGDDGDVEQLRVDSGVLQADNQIATLMALMEEMAGAPKQALGFRTPGEKTAFEVQTLQNAASRVFQIKITKFEVELLQPALNAMLEVARRNIEGTDLVATVDSETGVREFLAVSREDISSAGSLKTLGAQHFNTRNNIIQTLVQLSSTPIMQDPNVLVHFSGKKLAEVMEELLNLERFSLVSEYVRIEEQLEQQRLAAAAQEELGQQAQPAPEEAEQQ